MTLAPRLLLATTTWWPSQGVLASALEEAGFRVTMLAPKGHVASSASRFETRLIGRQTSAAALREALADVEPELIVAGDERVVADLLTLYRTLPMQWRSMIERSIGSPGAHHLLIARSALLDAAVGVAFDVPRSRVLDSAADLENWIATTPAPWVLKSDGSWGGEGVAIAEDRAMALRMWKRLRRGAPMGLALYRRAVNGDPFLMQDRHQSRPVAVSAQVHVAGRPANCAVFCDRGVVLGATMVEAVAEYRSRGPSTLVRVIDRPDLVNRIRALVASAGLSGFLGFDFIIDTDERAHLLEMNPRITMPCRLRGPFGCDPVSAAAETFAAARERRSPVPIRTMAASFPIAWLTDPFAPELLHCRADVPWREPAMLAASLKRLWPERGLLASLPSRLRRWASLLNGQHAVPDYRSRSFAWWCEHGGFDTRKGVAPTAKRHSSESWCNAALGSGLAHMVDEG